MKIVLMLLGIILLVGIVFLVIRSVIIKMVSLGLLVLSLVLVISLTATNFGGIIAPIGISEEALTLYIEGEPKEFLLGQVDRVDISELESGKLEITFTVPGLVVPIQMNGFVYEWAVKNILLKTFGNKVYDHRDW